MLTALNLHNFDSLIDKCRSNFQRQIHACGNCIVQHFVYLHLMRLIPCYMAVLLYCCMYCYYFSLFLPFTLLLLFSVFMFYGLMPEIKMDWIGYIIEITSLLRRLWPLLSNWLTRHVLSSCDCSWYMYVVWASVVLLWTSVRGPSLAAIRPYRKQVHFCHLTHLRSSQCRMRDWCRSSSSSSSSDRAALAAAASKDGIVA